MPKRRKFRWKNKKKWIVAIGFIASILGIIGFCRDLFFPSYTEVYQGELTTYYGDTKIIFDRDEKVVAQIEENKWIINKNNYFKMDTSASEIKVTIQYGEVALHCIALPDGSVKVNGTFYVDGIKIVATDQGLEITKSD